MNMKHGSCKIKRSSSDFSPPFHNQCYRVFHAANMHLKFETRSIKKGNSSIIEYLLRVKAIENSLLSVGDVVSNKIIYIRFLMDYLKIIIHLLWKCMRQLKHFLSMILRLFSMFKSNNLTNFDKNCLWKLFQQIWLTQIIKHVVCLIKLQTPVAEDTCFVAGGVVEDTCHLVQDLLVNCMENIGMLWWIVGIGLMIALHLPLLSRKLQNF